MSTFTTFYSRSKFELALATCPPKGEVCIIYRGTLEPSEIDPDLICEGAPIRLPCYYLKEVRFLIIFLLIIIPKLHSPFATYDKEQKPAERPSRVLRILGEVQNTFPRP